MTSPHDAMPGRARFRDLWSEAVRSLTRHPLRSALTALTSAVAIAVTVNVISLSYGLDADVRRDVSQFGRRTIDVGRLPIVIPGAQRAPLGPEQAEQLRETLADLGGEVVARRQVTGQVEGAARLDRAQIVGAPPTYILTLDVPMAAGSWLADDDEASKMCTVDAAAAQRLFPDVAFADVVGKSIDVRVPSGRHVLTIKGVLADPLTYRDLFETFDEGQGARTLASSLLSFRNVYVHEAIVSGSEYTGISIALPTEEAIPIARERLVDIWPTDASMGFVSMSRGVGIFVRKDWMSMLGGQTATGAALGNIVWIIIVLVAAIMISTLGLITIRERYDELAVRRCEGARRGDLGKQVALEGMITAVIGGIAGLPLGFAGAAALRQIVQFPFRFDLGYAGIATLIAALLGLLASWIPARRAAAIQPARVLGRRLT